MLHTEWDFYRKNRHEFLKLYPDKFIIIVGEEVKGAFTRFGDAYKTGVDSFGENKFMIQKISATEESNAICSKPDGVDERLRPKLMGFMGE
jgi:hypothetical protein